MPYVVNESDVALPAPDDLTPAEKHRLSELQGRAHLRLYDPKKSPQHPLTVAERAELVALELRVNDQRPPMWNSNVFAFAPKGQEGSVYEVPDNVAATVAAVHPKRLRVLEPDEEPPAGVKPLNMAKLARKQLAESRPRDIPWDEGVGMAAKIRDGSLRETGWQIPTQPEAL